MPRRAGRTDCPASPGQSGRCKRTRAAPQQLGGMEEGRGVPDSRFSKAATTGTPYETSYLEARQDEVHSFFWREDLEEAVAGQQNKPATQGRNIDGL